MSAMTTLAPSARNVSTIPSPRPEAPPVTITTLPLSSPLTGARPKLARQPLRLLPFVFFLVHLGKRADTRRGSTERREDLAGEEFRALRELRERVSGGSEHAEAFDWCDVELQLEMGDGLAGRE